MIGKASHFEDPADHSDGIFHQRLAPGRQIPARVGDQPSRCTVGKRNPGHVEDQMAGLRGQDRHQTLGQNRYSQEIQFAAQNHGGGSPVEAYLDPERLLRHGGKFCASNAPDGYG